MNIDIPDSPSEERPAINHTQHFIVACDSRLRQVLQVADNRFALPQMPKRHFAKDVGMAENLPAIEQRNKC